MSEIKVNSVKGVGASTAAITINNSDGTCTANVSNRPNRNLIINGSQEIVQRYGSAEQNPIVNGQIVTDRFIFEQSQTSKLKAQQVADGPAGFDVSLKVTSLSSFTSAASDYFLVSQYLEGLNTQHLDFGSSDAKYVTLSFYVKSSLTGTFAVAIRNQAHNRTNVQTYTINSANTWERKTVTFAGDTSGTWLKTNGIGLRVNFDLGTGSNFDAASLATWLGTNDLTHSSATPLVGTNAATWQVTGVQLEIGQAATDFEHRTFAQELRLCQRYYVKYIQQGVSGYIESSSANTAQLTHVVPVSMRANPSCTCTTATSIGVDRGGLYGINSTSGGLSWAYDNNLNVAWAMDTVRTRWHTTWCRVQNVQFNAEL